MMAKLAVSITCAKNDADKATVGFVVANAGAVSGVETVVFLSTDGVYLSQQGYSDDIHEEGFKPIKELIESFIDVGGTIWVCSPCFTKRGLSEDKLVGNSTIVGGAKLVEFLSQGVSCITY